MEKDIKSPKYVVVSKEVETDGIVEQKQFVKETIVLEHKKDEFIQNKQNQLIMIENEIERLQIKKSEIETELEEVTLL